MVPFLKSAKIKTFASVRNCGVPSYSSLLIKLVILDKDGTIG